MSSLLGRRARAGVRAFVALAALALPGVVHAQNIVSVPFPNGFIGTRGSSAGSSNAVKTYATLGIARTFFIQSSSTNQFELQGNDIPGTLRIVKTDGTTIDMPASANWRNSGGTTYLIGILPRPASPYTFTYAGGSIQITDGTVPGGTSLGGYVAAYAGATSADGTDVSGNAAQSQVLSSINSYLTTVVASRPAGPVTVTTQTTASTTPTIAGTATVAAGENLSVVVNGVQYTTSSTPAIVRNGTAWTLALTTPLALGTYSVTATITNTDGFTLSDATSNELVISSGGGTVTIGGTFTANAKVYDGTTTATGTTSGLTLSGINGADVVTIASVTLAFNTAAVGTGKTVSITAVTLGGANGAQYTVNLAGAPTATANVTARPLTITGLSAANRTYDGTTAAALGGTAAYANLASGESFAVSGTPSATFATAAIGTAKPVTVTGYTAPNGNYTLSQPTGLTASITAKSLTIGGSFSVSNKLFDGSTAATIATNALTLTGIVGADAVSLTGVTATFASAGVGTAKPVSIATATLTGAASSNYALNTAGAPTTTADITAPSGGSVTIAGTLSANDKTYDGTVAATGTTSGLTLVGVAGGDQVTIASVTLAFQTASAGAGKTVGIAAITLGGANGAQYAIDLTGAPTAIAAITTRALTITGVSAASKTYDGTTTASLTGTAAYANLASGESFSVTGASAATFGTSAVGTAKSVTVSGFTAPSANYTVSQPSGLTANISAKPLTIGGTLAASDKPFDGTTTATLNTSALTLVGVVGSDVVTIASATGAFSTSTVGAAKPVTLSAATLGGAAASNYTLSIAGAPTATANITAASHVVTIGGSFTAFDKLFDASVGATIDPSRLQLAGVQGGDDVRIASVTAAFADPSVGTNKRVSIVSLTLGGAAGATYTVNLAGAPTATASILPATPPSAPRSVVATAGDASITVTWTTPATPGCSAVTSYVVERSADGGQTWTRAGATAATTLTIAGLTNNIAYRVRVAAVNSCGTSPFADAPNAVAPIAPTRDPQGQPTTSTPGGAEVTGNGSRQPITVDVVQDTILRVTAGPFSLRLRATDAPGAAIPVDSSRTLELEQGGTATADGTGFSPASIVALFLVTPKGAPIPLGTAPVSPDGAFATTVPVAATLVPGNYTLQVNGIDRTGIARAAILGVEVAPPPPDLVLAAVPDTTTPAVGDTITITLTVTNQGRGPAIDVVIPRAFKEPGFTVIRTTPIDGTYDAPTQEWKIPRIDPTAHARMLITAIVAPPTSAPVPNP